MFSRNNNINNKSSNSWIYFGIALVIAITFFGAREQVTQRIRSYFMPDRAEIEKIIEDYINNNAKLIVNSVQEMQKREYEGMLKQAQMKIKDNKDALQGNKGQINLVAGNEKGDVVITAFLDYRCGYCKTNNKDLKKLIAQDKNVKIVFKELPVLGPQSQQLAKMALAVYLLDHSKYLDFHNAIMDQSNLDDKAIESILKSLNLDISKVNDAIQDPRVQKELDSVSELASQLNVRGTPAFIIGDDLIPGAISIDMLNSKIKEFRQEKNTK